MTHDSPTDEPRVLAVRPSTRGLGFAVLEGPERLIDWGVRGAKGDKNERCLRQVADLIEHYRPDVLVTEDYRHYRSRRSPRVRELLDRITERVSQMRVKTRKYPRAIVRKLLSQDRSATKHQIASALSERFPELAPQLPPKRKPWMAEDPRMNIFDAVALAFTFFMQKPQAHSDSLTGNPSASLSG